MVEPEDDDRTPQQPGSRWGAYLVQAPRQLFVAVLGVALAVELFQDTLRRLLLPDLLGPARILVDLLWLPALLGLLLWRVVIAPLNRELAAQVRTMRAREQRLVRETEGLAFEARLRRALEMGDTERDVMAVLERAVVEIGADESARLLLSEDGQPDGSLVPAVEVPGDRAHTPCDVAHSEACPAVRSGRTLEFSSSESLDACPRLREGAASATSAICMPVAVMGEATGVLQMLGSAGQRPDEDQLRRFRAVAAQSGAQLSMRRALARSRREATTDALTGLANRRTLQARHRAAVRLGAPLAVLLCDLDHFKRLNDEHGHDVGDEALRLFAEVLRRAVRPGDVPARFGGEEFAVLLVDCDPADAAIVADRVRAELAGALLPGRLPPFTVSVGVAPLTSGQELAAGVKAADRALYEAKRSGRDRVVVAGGAATGPATTAPEASAGALPQRV